MALVQIANFVGDLPVLTVAPRARSEDEAQALAARLLMSLTQDPGQAVAIDGPKPDWRRITRRQTENGWTTEVNLDSGRIRAIGPRSGEMFIASQGERVATPLGGAFSSVALPPTWTGTFWKPSAIDVAALSIEAAWERRAVRGTWNRARPNDPEYFLADSISSYCGGLTIKTVGVGPVPIVGEAASMQVRTPPSGAGLAELSLSPLTVTGQIADLHSTGSADAIESLKADLASRGDFADISVSHASLVYRLVAGREHGELLVPHWRLDASGTFLGEPIPLGVHFIPVGSWISHGDDGTLQRQDSIRNADGSMQWQEGFDRRAVLAWIGELGNFLLRIEIPMSLNVRTLLSDAQWDCQTFGGTKAVETDWKSNGEIQNADLGMYAGHANSNGWLLASPADKQAKFDDSAFGPRLKWIMVDACGPLQDAATATSSANAFKRWQKAFKGLRLFMAFATTKDRTVPQLQTALAMSLSGEPIMRSWIDAAIETAGTSADPTWAVCLYPQTTTGVQPSADRLSDSPDPAPVQPEIVHGLWVPFG